MLHIFHFLQSDTLFGGANLFPWVFIAIFNGKSCPILMPFLLTNIVVRTVTFRYKPSFMSLSTYKLEYGRHVNILYKVNLNNIKVCLLMS